MLRALCLCVVTTAVVFSLSEAVPLAFDKLEDSDGILISVEAGSSAADSKLSVTGSVQHIISDTERQTFDLSDRELKQAVGRYFGREPDDAYLHSPTPWNDLYKTYGWEEVKTVLVPTRSQIIGVAAQSIALKTQLFENHSSLTASYDVSITDTVRNVVTNTWTRGGDFSFGQLFKYEVGFLGTGGGGESKLSYTQSYGEGGTNSKYSIMGSKSGVSVTLQPSESVRAVLSATRSVLKARITYDAFLTGTTAVNYGSRYKGHYFWGMPISDVMSAAGKSNSIKPTEDIELGYFSNGKVTLHNVKTNEVVATYHL